MRGWIASAVLLIGLSAPALAGEPMQPEFSNGFRFASEDGAFSFGVSSMLNTDWSWYFQDDDSKAYGDIQDANEIRNARIGFGGVMYGNVQYFMQYDLASGSAGVTVAYMGVTGVPVLGTVRMGHLVEPFSMTFGTSPTKHPFMERPMLWVMTPGWNTGIMAFNTAMGGRMAWGLGLFKDTGGTGKAQSDDNIATTGRINGAVLNADGRTRLVRLGLALSHRKTSGSVRYVAGPESHLAPAMITSGNLAAETVDLVGTELAAVFGPLSIQAEGVASYVDVAGDSDPLLGYYARVGYFLTGESRPYSASGIPGRVAPRNSYGPNGMGAWEILVQYSALDFDGAGADAGVLSTISAALNWHLNPKTRIMFDYVYGKHDAGALAPSRGATSVIQTRFSIDI